MRRRSKRGGSIAEAAIIFPAVILAVLAVIYILTALYLEAAENTRDHIALRQEAGRITETFHHTDGYAHLAPRDKIARRPFRRTPAIHDEKRIVANYLFTERGRSYVVDEEKYIRKTDLLQRAASGDKKASNK